MKKIALVLALAVLVSVGSAFADHPSGLGIGVVGSYGGWDGSSAAGYGLSLKIPSVPIYWGINLGLGSDYFKLGLTGDKYLYDNVLSKDIGLHWFLGLGGFFNIFLYDQTYYGTSVSYNNMNFGVRVPIGLSFQPIPLLEIFLDIAPALGLYYNGGYSYKYTVFSQTYTYKSDSSFGFFWDAPIELGLRLWF